MTTSIYQAQDSAPGSSRLRPQAPALEEAPPKTPPRRRGRGAEDTSPQRGLGGSPMVMSSKEEGRSLSLHLVQFLGKVFEDSRVMPADLQQLLAFSFRSNIPSGGAFLLLFAMMKYGPPCKFLHDSWPRGNAALSPADLRKACEQAC